MAVSICRSHLRTFSRFGFPFRKTTHVNHLPSLKVTVVRSVSTSVVRLEEEKMDDLQKNPYYSKYANRIAELQKTSPEEFLGRLADLEKEKKGSDGHSDERGRGFSLPSKPKAASKTESSMKKEKKLSDRLKVDLLRDKSKEEISDIWRQYHVDKDCVSAVIPAEMYARMKERFQKHKTFLFPLPRKQGYEFIVVQFDGNEAHFATLINYQAFGANAPECLSLVHYPELADDKGIVLMVGEYDTNMLDTQEAKCLADQVEMYYCDATPEKLALLQSFTEKPSEFRHMDLVAQMESISLEQPAKQANVEETNKQM